MLNKHTMDSASVNGYTVICLRIIRIIAIIIIIVHLLRCVSNGASLLNCFCYSSFMTLTV